MTELKLNERLERLEAMRIELLPGQTARRTGRQNRRRQFHKKKARLLRIISRSYVPHAGYLRGGTYLQYPKNSRCQKWIKRATGKRVRGCPDIPIKGNFYRRLFDYWWTLY